MTFDQIALVCAVKAVYETVENPRSADWLIDLEKRKELCRLIQAELAITNEHEYLKIWDTYGKGSRAHGDYTKLDLIAEIAERDGPKCFWGGRVLGACSDDVDVDRLNPETRGGTYELANCVLSCSFHNRQRGNKSVEEYLRQGKL